MLFKVSISSNYKSPYNVTASSIVYQMPCLTVQENRVGLNGCFGNKRHALDIFDKNTWRKKGKMLNVSLT